MNKKYNPNDFVKVNLDVGGKYYTTTISTLTAEPNSMLHSMFSGKYPLELDENGRVFIDRDGYLFRYILFWLRNKKLPHLSNVDLDSLLIEAEYYQLSSLVDTIQKSYSSIDFSSETKVVTIVNCWNSFGLPGITIKTAQQRVQSAIEKEESEGWAFINSTSETCKNMGGLGNSVSTVNLVYLFFKKKTKNHIISNDSLPISLENNNNNNKENIEQ